MGWVVGGSLGGWVCDGVGGGGVGGWRVHLVGYNVKRFIFMNTHPPIKHIQSVTLLLYIYSPTHKHVIIFHFINTHPFIKHNQGVTLSLYKYF